MMITCEVCTVYVVVTGMVWYGVKGRRVVVCKMVRCGMGRGLTVGDWMGGKWGDGG